MRKNIITTVFCAGGIFSLLLMSGCVKNELAENDSATGEIKFSTSVNMVKSGTKCEDEENYSDPVSVIELKSEDGSIVIPMAMYVGKSKNADVKGSFINTTGSDQDFPTTLPFTVHAFKGTESFFVESDSVAVWNSNRNRWTLNKTYYWPADTEMEFYAYANLPENPAGAGQAKIAFVEKDLDKHLQKLTYVVPDHTDKQRDILLATYKGNGNASGEAELTFQHPLAAVQFIVDESMKDFEGTISITMDGVYLKGTVEQSIEDPKIFDWDPVTIGTTVTQDNHGLPLEIHGKVQGDPFLVIPQVQEPGQTFFPKISFRIVIRINGHDVPLNGEADLPIWNAGEIITYKIGYTGGLKIALECEDFSGIQKKNAIVKNIDVRPCFVRAMVIGYVLNDKGYIRNTWFNSEGGIKGVFDPEGFGSPDTRWNTNWLKGPGGFYYYTIPLEALDKVGDKTTPLFNSYLYNEDMALSDQFIMDIAVQSVEYDKNLDYVAASWGPEVAIFLKDFNK